MGSHPIVYDKAKYHFESVREHGLPEIHAYIHTGFFVGWLIENELLDEEFAEECEEEIARFRKHELSAPQLFRLWDGALVDDMLNDEGNAFAQAYFDFQKGRYIQDYSENIAKNLKSEFHVQDSSANFAAAKAIIDDRFRRWKLSLHGGGGRPEATGIAPAKKPWWKIW